MGNFSTIKAFTKPCNLTQIKYLGLFLTFLVLVFISESVQIEVTFEEVQFFLASFAFALNVFNQSKVNFLVNLMDSRYNIFQLILREFFRWSGRLVGKS